MTILVVEDDPGIQEMITELLQEEGYPLLQAHTGAQALALLAAPPASLRLIILDLMLPGVSGWEVVQHMQHEPLLQAIPVLILSALSPTVLQTAPLPAAAVLTKPFVITEFLDMVAQLYGAPLPVGA